MAIGTDLLKANPYLSDSSHAVRRIAQSRRNVLEIYFFFTSVTLMLRFGGFSSCRSDLP
ncbi:hypothetical protein GcM3_222023 [Golovinomyces cichoracearum]|uniref:Uncharacterized protein n=1 Tax=Golovinomyces cichoracearum TaxID=62708 RepID=A0A420H1W2_9PEZI|nr:hypothetical protein GcM3_222023 [Golovinomyces cichoracearum]